MEVRLNKRQKIKQLFKKLFKPAVSKKVLQHYLDELESKRSILSNYKATSNKALLAALVFNNPELKPKQILQMFGLKKILETVTMRELRVIFARHNKRSWYRLVADANKVKLPIAQLPFGIIRKHLNKFKTLRIEKCL